MEFYQIYAKNEEKCLFLHLANPTSLTVNRSSQSTIRGVRMSWAISTYSRAYRGGRDWATDWKRCVITSAGLTVLKFQVSFSRPKLNSFFSVFNFRRSLEWVREIKMKSRRPAEISLGLWIGMTCEKTIWNLIKRKCVQLTI